MKFQQCILLENVTSSTGTDNLGKCPNPMTIRIVTIGKIANLKLPVSPLAVDAVWFQSLTYDLFLL